MKLSAYLSREGQQVPVLRTNDEDTCLVIGICNDLTDHLLSIIVHPTGEMTCTYHKIGDEPGDAYEIGKFYAAGMLELYEPKKLQT